MTGPARPERACVGLCIARRLKILSVVRQTDWNLSSRAQARNPRYRRPSFLLVPGRNIPALYERKCWALHRVGSFADGCADLAVVARRLARLPLYRRGPDYLIYDMRGRYARQPASLTEPVRSLPLPPTS